MSSPLFHYISPFALPHGIELEDLSVRGRSVKEHPTPFLTEFLDGLQGSQAIAILERRAGPVLVCLTGEFNFLIRCGGGYSPPPRGGHKILGELDLGADRQRHEGKRRPKETQPGPSGP